MRISKFIRRILGIEKRLERLELVQKAADAHFRQMQSLYHLLNKEMPEDHAYVIPKLRGGLGNQMFQIAAAFALAEKTGAKLALNYEQCIDPLQGNPAIKYKDTLYKNIPETSYWPFFSYEYWDFVFWPLFPVKNIALIGLFHSSKYFHGHVEGVKKLFTFPEAIQSEARSFLKKDSRPTVGIHVRLGDFRSVEHRETLYICTSTYFRNALKEFSPAKYRFILCSDEPAEARKFLGSLNVEVFQGSSDLAEMHLLSQCNNLIISNSTFSWWAAYLGIPKDKVIAPKNWFGKKCHQVDTDIFEPDWIKVPTSVL